jgi:hypothetical protein
MLDYQRVREFDSHMIRTKTLQRWAMLGAAANKCGDDIQAPAIYLYHHVPNV